MAFSAKPIRLREALVKLHKAVAARGVVKIGAAVSRAVEQRVECGGFDTDGVAHLHVGYKLSDLFHNAGKFMAERLPFLGLIGRPECCRGRRIRRP